MLGKWTVVADEAIQVPCYLIDPLNYCILHLLKTALVSDPRALSESSKSAAWAGRNGVLSPTLLLILNQFILLFLMMRKYDTRIQFGSPSRSMPSRMGLRFWLPRNGDLPGKQTHGLLYNTP